MRKRNWHRERLSEVAETGWGFRHGTRSGDAGAEPCRQGAGTEQKLELVQDPSVQRHLSGSSRTTEENSA